MGCFRLHAGRHTTSHDSAELQYKYLGALILPIKLAGPLTTKVFPQTNHLSSSKLNADILELVLMALSV